MLNKYRRAARTAAELRLGWLVALDEGIAELTAAPLKSVKEPELPSKEASGKALDGTGERTARGRLVGALTEAVRGFLFEGDSASARIAINALLQLADGGTPVERQMGSPPPSSGVSTDVLPDEPTRVWVGRR